MLEQYALWWCGGRHRTQIQNFTSRKERRRLGAAHIPPRVSETRYPPCLALTRIHTLNPNLTLTSSSVEPSPLPNFYTHPEAYPSPKSAED